MSILAPIAKTAPVTVEEPDASPTPISEPAVAQATPTPTPSPSPSSKADLLTKKTIFIESSSTPAELKSKMVVTPQLTSVTQGIQGVPSFAWQSDQGDGTFKNPILYADYADPDITRVGDDFYMVSTTFVNSPGINLLHSKDLVNWELAAQVAPTVDGGPAYDMVDGKTAYQNGYWASSIRHYKDTFYIAVQPNFTSGRIYYATNPAGPWQYHQLDRGIYDPGLFIDTDGTGYIVCGHSPQSLMKLSPDFSKIVEEKKDFLNSGAEGSHMIRRKGYYYVFNANPGIWPFQLICSRTPSLTNPKWEKRIALTAVTGGHQGAIVDLDDKDHWYGFVHHDSGSIGRMPQIGPVFWENDWPIFGTPEKRDIIAEVNQKPITGKPLSQVAASDDFKTSKLGLQWAWNHNPDNSRWSLTEHPGFLRLHPTQAADFWTARNTLTQKAQGPRCQGVVKLDLGGMKPGDIAGFGTLGKVNGHIDVTMDAQGQKTLGMRMIKDKVGSYEGASGIPLTGNTLYLRTDLDFVKNLAICSYSTDGMNWTPIGGNFELLFGYGSTFQGEQFAIFCYNPQTSSSPGYVDIDSFTLMGLDEKSALIHAQRGRPHINAAHTTFVADNGQLLRGPYKSTEWTKAPPLADVERVKELGFNAVHLYAESFDPKYPTDGSHAPGYATEEIDKMVEMTRDLGLYLVITIGNGAFNGKFNQQWILDFWKIYAARYAKETHVLFEVQNEPVAWGPPYIDPKATPPNAVPMEAEAYKTIRSVAPDSPILLFSYSVLGDKKGAEAALQDIEAFNTAVGGEPSKIWSNAAVAFHGYAGHVHVPVALADILAAGYPCVMTEFIAPPWGGEDAQDIELTASLERLGISWFTFLTIPPNGVSPLVTKPEVFKDIIDHSGIAWTPDFSTWPVARQPFGNNALPHDTTTMRAKDVLQGTTHLELEDFDTGGEDVSYHVKNPNLPEKPPYRTNEVVTIRQITDGTAGYAVHAEEGEWFDYTLYVREPGTYQLSLRYAADQAGILRFSLGGKEFAQIPFEKTSSSTDWKTLTQPVFLEYGQKVLRIAVLKGSCDLNWLELTPVKDGPIPDGTYKIVNRGSSLVMANATTTNGNVIQQLPFENKNTQLWQFEHLGAGQYRISSPETKSDKKLYWNADVGAGKGIGLVWWGNQNPGPMQRFVIRSKGDGFFRIAPVDLGLDLDVENASLISGAAIQQHVSKGDAHQEWAIQPPEAPPIPTGLTAESLSPSQVNLHWNPVPGATAYRLKRATSSGGPYTVIPSFSTQTAAIDRSVPLGTNCYYVVSAMSRGGESCNSAEVTPAHLITNLKFDESSGSVAEDSSGNGWRGTLLGNPKHVPGHQGNAILLDGLDSYITLPTGIVSNLEDFTITAWVNLDALSPWSRIFDFGTGSTSYMFLTPFDGNGLHFAINSGSGEQAITSSKPLPLGQWAHVALVMKQGVGILYLNGEEIGRNASLPISPKSLGKTTENYIGKSRFPDAGLKGKLDDFRIYDNALSPSELSALAKSPSSR